MGSAREDDATEDPPDSGRSRGATARRAGWNVGDQALSALTNVAMSVIVARQVSAEEFGAFAAAFLVFGIVVGTSRAIVGTPLSIRHSDAPPDDQHTLARYALGAALALAVPISTGLVVAGLLLAGEVGQSLLALAAALPFLVLQDTCRMAFFAWANPRRAALIDAVWAVVELAIVAALIGTNRVAPDTMVLAWGAGALVSALIGMALLRATPTARGVRRWLAGNRHTIRYLLLTYATAIGAQQCGVLVIGGLLGLGDLGSLRAAELLLGPLGVITAGIMTFAVPEVARGRERAASPMRTAALTSAAAVTFSGLYAAMLLLIPGWVGEGLLGATWTGASLVLLPMALASTLAAGKLGPSPFIYGLNHVRSAFRLSATFAVAVLGLMALGAAHYGVVGVAWGMCGAQLLVVPLWFMALRALTRDRAQPPTSPHDPTPSEPSVTPSTPSAQDAPRTAGSYARPEVSPAPPSGLESRARDTP